MPRIPLPVQEIQPNFCRNVRCPNFGVPADPEQSRNGRGNASPDGYILTGSKNFKAIRCTLCSQNTALKSNAGIAEELKRLEQYLVPESTSSTPETCPNPDCPSQVDPESFGEGPTGFSNQFIRKGLSGQKQQRWQCRACGRIFILNPQTTRAHCRPEKNKQVFLLLVNKVPLTRICEIAGINISTVYAKIEFIQRQCLLFAAEQERKLREGHHLLDKKLRISVDQQAYLLNWSEREDKRNVVLYGVTSADNPTDYVFGSHVNHDPDLDPLDINRDAYENGDTTISPPFRKYARLWLECDYQESTHRTKKGLQQTSVKDQDLIQKIDETYRKMMVNRNTESSEDMGDTRALPHKGMQVHSEYTFFAHFLFLSRLLRKARNIDFFLDQDHRLRNACFNAFHKRIKDRTCDAFFVRINKEMTIDEKKKLVQKSKSALNKAHNMYPNLPFFDIKVKILTLRVKKKRYPQVLGLRKSSPQPWEQDGWVRFPFPRMNEPEKAVCFLTDMEDYSDRKIARKMMSAGLYGVDTYFQQVRRRMSLLERPIFSSAAGRKWFGYSPYDPSIIQKLLDILRVYHNFILKGEDGKNPAMRMGLKRAPMKIEDILYFGRSRKTKGRVGRCGLQSWIWRPPGFIPTQGMSQSKWRRSS